MKTTKKKTLVTNSLNPVIPKEKSPEIKTYIENLEKRVSELELSNEDLTHKVKKVLDRMGL